MHGCKSHDKNAKENFEFERRRWGRCDLLAKKSLFPHLQLFFLQYVLLQGLFFCIQNLNNLVQYLNKLRLLCSIAEHCCSIAEQSRLYFVQLLNKNPCSIARYRLW